jgi:hypothetical protein
MQAVRWIKMMSASFIVMDSYQKIKEWLFVVSPML